MSRIKLNRWDMFRVVVFAVIAIPLIVPLCVLAVWWMRGLHQPPYMILLGLGLAAVLALVHGTVTYSWAESVQPAGLARGTVKMVAVWDSHST